MKLQKCRAFKYLPTTVQNPIDVFTNLFYLENFPVNKFVVLLRLVWNSRSVKWKQVQTVLLLEYSCGDLLAQTIEAALTPTTAIPKDAYWMKFRSNISLTMPSKQCPSWCSLFSSRRQPLWIWCHPDVEILTLIKLYLNLILP